MSDRKEPPVRFTTATLSPEFRAFADEIERALGYVTSLCVVPLLLSETGVGYTAVSGGTAIVQGHTAVDFEDARIDQIRLVGWGGSSGSGDSVRLVDGSTTLVTATLASSVGAITGGWTNIDTIGAGTRTVVAQVVGNGVRTQTLHSLTLQMRTLRLPVR